MIASLDQSATFDMIDEVLADLFAIGRRGERREWLAEVILGREKIEADSRATFGPGDRLDLGLALLEVAPTPRDGWQHHEIAAACGVSLITIKRLTESALSKLRTAARH